MGSLFLNNLSEIWTCFPLEFGCVVLVFMIVGTFPVFQKYRNNLINSENFESLQREF